MSNKRVGRALADVMGEIEDEPTAPVPALLSEQPAAEIGKDFGPSIVPINILVTPEDRKRLRQLGLDSGLSLQKLGHEAWNRLLESRGLKPLEKVAANVPSGRSRR